jgi:hypothetical protein
MNMTEVERFVRQEISSSFAHKRESREALAELSLSVTPAKAGVHKSLKNLDSGFRRNDAQELLQEAQDRPANPLNSWHCRVDMGLGMDSLNPWVKKGA